MRQKIELFEVEFQAGGLQRTDRIGFKPKNNHVRKPAAKFAYLSGKHLKNAKTLFATLQTKGWRTASTKLPN